MKYLTVISLLALLLSCEKQQPVKVTEGDGQKRPFYAVGIFSVGKITLNSQEFKYGSILKENETLILEPKSICDLQLFKEENVIRETLQTRNNFAFGMFSLYLFQLAHCYYIGKTEEEVLQTEPGWFTMNMNLLKIGLIKKQKY